ncbi:hypothetical protein [Citrobacter freundii]|nr:hypothetical protein [Citrobacter youngae]
MAWNGIPFPLLDSLTKENIVLQIAKLPTIIVDSGFPWESLLGSLIAGGIPAFIAWKTIKYNNELIKRQITVAAQQKKCDELREIFSKFLSLYETCVSYVDLLYNRYQDDLDSLSFEKYSEIRGDLTNLAHCTNLIYLMIGTNNEYYERMTSMVNTLENKISTYFENYEKNSSKGAVSIESNVKEFLELFNEILDMEQSKI